VKVRDVRFGPNSVSLTQGEDGAMYVRSNYPLENYPDRLTDRLDYWAAKTPDQVFLARRDSSGGWRTKTYAETRAEARRVAQGLLSRPLSSERPITVLSGNDIEHGLIELGAMYAGIPYAPVSPAYSLVSTDFGKLRHIFGLLTPGLVYAADVHAYRKAIDAVLPENAELITAETFSALSRTPATEAVDRAYELVGPDTVAKILFTSGSTGVPKGVINTQRMLASNQEIVRSILAFVDEEPPILCDWMPWNHTFGGNHDFGFVLYNGGSLYIDEGKPTPGGIETTIRNLEDVRPNVYLNVPKGFEALLPHLRGRPGFRERFFSRLKLFYYAGAGISQPVWDALQRHAVEECGEQIVMFTGLGSTETGPAALFPGKDLRRAGDVGLPAPGVELKLVPRDGKLELRLRGPSITPGYWRQPELTRDAFDEEGFYKIGDALRFVDPDDVQKGFSFDGRLAEDFKLSTGTWVSMGPLRARFLHHCSPYAQDVAIAGHERDDVTALIFPAADACKGMTAEQVRETFERLLRELAAESTGSSNRIARAMIMTEPPSIDRYEMTDKGSLNQGAILRNRAELVEELYAGEPSARVIVVGPDAVSVPRG
jgi:feruloyl-CoA synthase